MEYISYKIKRGNFLFFFYQENNSTAYMCNVNDHLLQTHSLFLSFFFFLDRSSVSTINSSEKFIHIINADNILVY